MGRHRTEEISLGIGTPEPKATPQHIGGPKVAFQLHDSEQVLLSVAATDAEGNPSGATIAFSSSDDTIVAVTDNGDGTALAVASPGAAGLGSATVSVTATDADGSTASGAFDIEVIPGDTVAVNITPGTPEAKPV
jgi:hypothetical protein